MQENLQQAGYEISRIVTFSESDDFKVARISVSPFEYHCYWATVIVTVFVSCTSLRVLSIMQRLNDVTKTNFIFKSRFCMASYAISRLTPSQQCWAICLL